MRADTQKAIENDDALLVAFAAGSPDAARQLAAHHLPRVYAVALRMLGQQSEAEDVAQEAMLRLWNVAPDWQPGRAQLSTWLYRVASNLATDRLRARQRNRPAGEGAVEALADTSPGVEQNLIAAERDGALHRAIAALPARQKLAITLRHFEELGQQDIAEAMDTTVEAVESLLGRARRALATMLAPIAPLAATGRQKTSRPLAIPKARVE
ncbi:MAG: sigma-70 family RNA polymerase sigma factor [Paracoccaceae bacterium]